MDTPRTAAGEDLALVVVGGCSEFERIDPEVLVEFATGVGELAGQRVLM